MSDQAGHGGITGFEAGLCAPAASAAALDGRAKDDDDDPEMRVFKAELRQAITHPDQVLRAELSSHVQYDDGSPEAFLRRLWRDLYGDESVTTPGPALNKMMA